MADINNKPKLQLRSGVSINGDKTPSPATKLLISHGKPNFTIQRSPKIQNGNGNVNPLSPQITAPKNEFVVKSTTFNGVFKPANISAASKQSLQQNGDDNEASKVVLRRTKVAEPTVVEGEDANVPEFIRRQRRIQERLAKDNLDFENRRSGYFTQVMISPSSPNRKSFVETMSSPAVVPGLEMPPPPQPERIEESDEERRHEESKEELLQEIAQEIVQESHNEGELVAAVPIALNGHDEEDEVNRAIEEVNKAVAGEDEVNEELMDSEEVYHAEPSIVAVSTLEYVEETKSEEPQQVAAVTSSLMEEPEAVEAPVHAAVTSALMEEPQIVEAPVQAAVTSALLVEEEPQQNGHVEAVVTSALLVENETQEAEAEPKSNGVIEQSEAEPKTNGVHEEQPLQNGNGGFTISHTNALSSPSLPSPDPSGEKGVNYEPKTVVSFSRDMGEPNKYPDTVKVVKDGESPSTADDELKEMVKLKFEIKGDEQDFAVTPVLKVE